MDLTPKVSYNNYYYIHLLLKLESIIDPKCVWISETLLYTTYLVGYNCSSHFLNYSLFSVKRKVHRFPGTYPFSLLILINLEITVVFIDNVK